MSITNRSNKLFEQTRLDSIAEQDLIPFGQLQDDGTYKVRNITQANLLDNIVLAESITHAALLAESVAGEIVPGKVYTITDANSDTLSLFAFGISASQIGELTFDTTTGEVYTYNLATDVALAGVSTGSIDLTPQTAPSYLRGRVWYDSTNETISFYDNISGTSVQISQEELVRARNSTGSTILNGAVVYISGAQGQNPRISLARANAENTSRVIGMATHDIANNSVGKVCTFGIVGDLNTSSYNEGDVLYLSSSSAGGLTTTRPSAPNQAVMVGTVVHAAITDGKILVHPDNYGIGYGAANQLRAMNAAGNGEEYKSITSSDDTITIDHNANEIDIITNNINGTPGKIVKIGADGKTGVDSIIEEAGDGITVDGVVTSAGVSIGNGEYLKARRNTGNLLIDLLGIEAGTDDTRLQITGDFNIKNGAGFVLVNITTGGSVTFNGSVSATRANFSSLPTSASGLNVGDLWRDGEIVKIKL